MEFNLSQLFIYCIMKHDDRLVKKNGEVVDFYVKSNKGHAEFE